MCSFYKKKKYIINYIMLTSKTHEIYSNFDQFECTRKIQISRKHGDFLKEMEFHFIMPDTFEYIDNWQYYVIKNISLETSSHRGSLMSLSCFYIHEFMKDCFFDVTKNSFKVKLRFTDQNIPILNTHGAVGIMYVVVEYNTILPKNIDSCDIFTDYKCVNGVQFLCTFIGHFESFVNDVDRIQYDNGKHYYYFNEIKTDVFSCNKNINNEILLRKHIDVFNARNDDHKMNSLHMLFSTTDNYIYHSSNPIESVVESNCEFMLDNDTKLFTFTNLDNFVSKKCDQQCIAGFCEKCNKKNTIHININPKQIKFDIKHYTCAIVMASRKNVLAYSQNHLTLLLSHDHSISAR
ncbi:hypothetical protein BMW23_0788 [Bodo saltans virus]|uniref:Uncharacterized protein n=1 Tax=Bodo saltans virus TaxID=2024608 RepID=A0A2H4UVE1_9VIRU|nr:hypothetical protein QJ851_gp0771 [Bodo saltans virus]ATZ80834.1 hypothetical protein BMW23_0788 [Bodo saltans virus]